MKSLVVVLAIVVLASGGLALKGRGAPDEPVAALEPVLACLQGRGVPAEVTVSSTGTRQIHVRWASSAYVSFFASTEEAGWQATGIEASIRAAQIDPAGLVDRHGGSVVAWGTAPSPAERAAVSGCLA
ncbi:MAG: hypothetical protein ACRDN6_11785 [Gaiellaceae bacterium]